MPIKSVAKKLGTLKRHMPNDTLHISHSHAMAWGPNLIAKIFHLVPKTFYINFLDMSLVIVISHILYAFPGGINF